MRMQPNKAWASDANFTLRLTYGRVLPYDPADGIHYNYYTTLKGVMEKENPLNAKGALIGLAFDGNWEAMSGDVAFEPELQRTIAVDVRYVLFVIDKFAGAGWLLDELQFE